MTATGTINMLGDNIVQIFTSAAYQITVHSKDRERVAFDARTADTVTPITLTYDEIDRLRVQLAQQQSKLADKLEDQAELRDNGSDAGLNAMRQTNEQRINLLMQRLRLLMPLHND